MSPFFRNVWAFGFTLIVRLFWPSPALILFALFSSCIAFGQVSPSAPKVSDVPPDVFVNVREYPAGPEMVTITVRKEGYPTDLLKAQCEKIGLATGSPIRGLQLSSTDLETTEAVTLARASFATDELVTTADRGLNLEAIVQAFVGGPKAWQVNALLVSFENQAPTERTLQSLNTDSVLVGSQLLSDPNGIEYRVLLLTQDPELVNIPTLVDIASNQPASPAVPTGPSPVLYLILAIGALSGGALVYFAALRPSSRR
jgi:hypothetical protein